MNLKNFTVKNQPQNPKKDKPIEEEKKKEKKDKKELSTNEILYWAIYNSIRLKKREPTTAYSRKNSAYKILICNGK